MQISGDNSRRIDYSEGRKIHLGWAQECEEETVANLRCRARRVRLLSRYEMTMPKRETWGWSMDGIFTG